MRRAAKVDANQGQIVMTLATLGWFWIDLTRAGGGCPDGIVSRGNVLRLIEIKGAKGTLTPEQARLHQFVPVTILRTVQDAIDLR